MTKNAILAVPLAITWMMVTATISLEYFLVGWLIGLAILVVLNAQNTRLEPARLPRQLWALTRYSLTLCRDIWLSSVDVTKRVLDPKLPLKSGILRVPTQDPNESEVVAAFSAHGITITPGELVVDFEGKHMMYVHCLDVEASGQTLHAAQTRRLQLLNEILGRWE